MLVSLKGGAILKSFQHTKLYCAWTKITRLDCIKILNQNVVYVIRMSDTLMRDNGSGSDSDNDDRVLVDWTVQDLDIDVLVVC